MVKIVGMDEHFSYRGVANALARSNSKMGAAECHGMCCGILCISGSLNVDAMAARFTGDADSDNSDAAAGHFSALLMATIAQLDSGEFDLRLLLPDDDDPLAERSEALAEVTTRRSSTW